MENPTFQKANSQITDNKEIPLWQKYTLTVEEAACYFCIGQSKLRRVISENEDAVFILWNGNRPQIKRKLFEEFVDRLNVIWAWHREFWCGIMVVSYQSSCFLWKERKVMAEKRRDKKGRILRKGELQRSDGRYMYRYTNANGDRQVEYSWRLVESDPQPQGRKKELSLREKEALIEQDRYDMISTSYGSMTVNELFDFYVKMKQKRGKITVRTIENYTKIWNKNMRKRKFAGMQIQAVRKTHILDCYQEMLEDGVGNGSITLIHKVLSAMFNHAVSEDYIRRNYAHGCTKELGIYNNKRDALTQAQQVEFLNFVRESKEYSPHYWMFEFFFETGTRCGEGIGLLWENVDFRNKFIKIDHQLLYELDEQGRRRFQICPPKTIKGIRKIPLTAKALHALKKQKEYMLKHGMLENFTVDSYSGFVFLTKRFQLWSAAQLDIILHRIVYDYNSIEAANAIKEDKEPELLPNITAHILRHTACTRMAEAGMDQRTLQEIMGHSNLAITMKVYNHVDDKRMRDEIEKFDAKRDGKEKVS